ncbi:MAG: hypothetical protein WD011_07575 [Nitriliruptoraceae bacterium]
MRALARWVATATAVAAIIGVARQRREALAVRRGELEPASAMADLLPQVEYGVIAGRIARWTPEATQPVRPGRARLWSAPLTLCGFFVARLGGATPRWDEDHACYVAIGVGGLSRLLLRRVGAHANTIGQVVIITVHHPSAALVAHEAMHVRQMERFGPLMPLLYVWMGALYGYRDNPFEHAARAGARRAVTTNPPDETPPR